MESRLCLKVVEPVPFANEDGLLRGALFASISNLYDPVGSALREAAEKMDIDVDVLQSFSILHRYDARPDAHKTGNVLWIGNLLLCSVEESECAEIRKQYDHLAGQGYLVLAIAYTVMSEDYPKVMDECKMSFIGLLAFKSAPKHDLAGVIEDIQTTGIRLVMMTHIDGITAKAISENMSMPIGDVIDGYEVDHLSDTNLIRRATDATIFSNITPISRNFALFSPYRHKERSLSR